MVGAPGYALRADHGNPESTEYLINPFAQLDAHNCCALSKWLPAFIAAAIVRSAAPGWSRSIEVEFRRPHFAHYHAPESRACFETALHKLAKQVVFDARALLLPDFSKAPVHDLASHDLNFEIKPIMCAHRTPTEVRQHCIDSMGDQLGRLYHELSNELAWLTIKWSEYVELFGTKPSRIELLNEAAGGFFRLIQDALWDDLLLHIARLTDRAEMGRRRNLTILALPNLIDRPEIGKAVSEKIGASVELAGFARDWRNRRIAHRDLALSLEEGVEPLIPASREKFRQALSTITDVMNEVSRAYLNSTIAYDFLENAAGAISLLHVLDDGIRAERKRKDRLKSKDYREDDFLPRDL